VLEQRAQRERLRQAAVDAIEQFQQPARAPTPDLLSMARDEPFQLGRDDLAEQLLARAKPAIDRCPSQTQPAGDVGEVKALAAQELLAGEPEHVVAGGCRRPPRPPYGLALRACAPLEHRTECTV
jgi:hypothetical protein